MRTTVSASPRANSRVTTSPAASPSGPRSSRSVGPAGQRVSAFQHVAGRKRAQLGKQRHEAPAFAQRGLDDRVLHPPREPGDVVAALLQAAGEIAQRPRPHQAIGVEPGSADARLHGRLDAAAGVVNALLQVAEHVAHAPEPVLAVHLLDTTAVELHEAQHVATGALAARDDEAPQLGGVAHRELGRVARGRRAHVGGEVGERRVHLVSDGADHRDRGRGDGAHDGLLVERPQSSREPPPRPTISRSTPP